MRQKRTFAVGIALLMLCVSSFASVCELSCSLPHSAAMPAHNSASQQPGPAGVMIVHSHCGDVAVPVSSHPASYNLESGSNCSGSPCGPTTTFSSPVNARENAVRAVDGQSAILATVSGSAASALTHFDLLTRTDLGPPLQPIDSRVTPLRI